MSATGYQPALCSRLDKVFWAALYAGAFAWTFAGVFSPGEDTEQELLGRSREVASGQISWGFYLRSNLKTLIPWGSYGSWSIAATLQAQWLEGGQLGEAWLWLPEGSGSQRAQTSRCFHGGC